MFSYIEGKLAELSIGKCIIDVNGIGFFCRISLNTFQALSIFSEGDKIKLYQYLHVKEDELSLYGFADEQEKELFLRFIQVEGIGPKKALEIFNFGTAATYIEAIEAQDITPFTRVRGIGQKQASKLILELTGKLGNLGTRPISILNEVTEGLTSMGFSKNDIESAIKKYTGKFNDKSEINSIPFEQLLKDILALLSRY
jgi:Holliday junction DNA helicase RuvA